MLAALTLVLLAGGMNGSFAAPMKHVRDWEWEHTWLAWSSSAMIVIPLTVAVVTVPNLWAVYRAAGPESLMRTALYGMLWGASAVLFGLGITRIGLALGFGIILGTASSLGALVPFVELHRDRLFTIAGLLTFIRGLIEELPVPVRSSGSGRRGEGAVFVTMGLSPESSWPRLSSCFLQDSSIRT